MLKEKKSKQKQTRELKWKRDEKRKGDTGSLPKSRDASPVILADEDGRARPWSLAAVAEEDFSKEARLSHTDGYEELLWWLTRAFIVAATGQPICRTALMNIWLLRWLRRRLFSGAGARSRVRFFKNASSRGRLLRQSTGRCISHWCVDDIFVARFPSTNFLLLLAIRIAPNVGAFVGLSDFFRIRIIPNHAAVYATI
uniref:Uncharacterized protein n=1 Tax=Romanomermis culicivorax TaxID=13658 RepID=A0A915IJ16_ROMCU